jgi:O-antigen/teichoic acid export membrane protein
MTNYTKKALKNVGIVFVLSIVAAFFGYLVRIFFAHKLSSIEDFGLFYAIIAFLGLFGIFKSFGLDKALIFFIPKFLAESNTKRIKNSIIYTAIILFANNIIFLLLILLFANFLGINYFDHGLASKVLVLMAISFFIDSFVFIIKFSFQGFQRMAMFSSIDLTRMIIILSISFIFFEMGYDIFSPVIAYIAAPIILIFIYAPLLYNKNSSIFIKNKFFWDKPLFKKLRKYGLQIILFSAGGIILSYSDRLMLVYFKTLEDVGVYSAVFPTAMLIWYIPMAITNVIIPLTSELWGKRLYVELKKGIELLYRFSLIVILPVSLLLFVFSNVILEIFYGTNYATYGTGYLTGSIALKILAIGIIFYSFHMVNSGIFSGIGKPNINTKIIGFGAILNILLNFILIPKFGFVGAAIATMITFTSMMFFGLYILEKKNIVKIPYTKWIKTFLLSMCFLFVVNYLNMQMTMNLFIKIPIILLSSGLVYVIFLFILKLVTIPEVKELLKRLRKT